MLFTGFEDRGLMLRGYCPRRIAAICVRHPQEWSFRHSLTTVGGRKLDSNAVDGVVLLLPPRRWVVSVSSDAGARSLWWQRLCSGRGVGREPDSKSADVVLEVRLLPPSGWATAVEVSGVDGALFFKQALVNASDNCS